MGTLKFKPAYMLYLVPAFLITGIFFLLPFFQVVYFSTTDWDGIFGKTFVGLSNYIEIFSLEMFRQSIWRVLQFAFFQAAICVLMGLIFGYILKSRVRGGGFFRSVFFMPVMISSSAICVMFVVMYDNDFGLINNLLRLLGLGSLTHVWLSDASTAFYACIAVQIWAGIGMHIVILLSGYRGISEEYFEAAAIDGANTVQIFRCIALPSLRPIIQVCVVLAVSGAFKSFDYIYILTMGGPAGASHVPATMMYEKAFRAMRWGLSSSIAVFIFLLGLLFTVVFNHLTRDRD